jgi:hypothetical protein
MRVLAWVVVVWFAVGLIATFAAAAGSDVALLVALIVCVTVYPIILVGGICYLLLIS